LETKMPATDKVNLTQKFNLFGEHWSPKIVGQVDDYHIKVVKIQGEFVWHKHEDVDELFLVVDGQFTMQMRDGDVIVKAGEMINIPAGVEHCPLAEQECQIVLFEKAGTVNTGDAVDSEKTVQEPDRI
jgi:mannose-6-phosphate isomerase-like protein (cupin superfamily)